ncbi:structural maintenance of chromosomes protein 6A [Cannabis sativa]|uniref:structural maintenance of chromosomes protein 6A n=1 Tax=Cannabis sativa TaxID=3483 RepID=UPI0029CA5093|nr:structural maintenance of chromosomes protein 6A [Cannabis sativa]
MGDNGTSSFRQSKAGTVRRIRLENFMCHSNLVIELIDRVNFITGQNGSGKSAVLTALCIAFGCRAKGTQRASTLKDFIKTGCSSTVVIVEINNEGDDAFKPETYGSTITIERRISESASTTVLKDCRGKKVTSKKDELLELVDYFNIDVENPCVIMSQDKSREFLHSGNDKDKFKFFFKATLLQRVHDLLEMIDQHLKSANGTVCELEDAVKPIEKELNELQEKINNMKHVERASLELRELKKKLAWSWVYKVDRDLQEQRVIIDKRKSHIPVIQSKIDRRMEKMEELGDILAKKKSQISSLIGKMTEVQRRKDEIQHKLSSATKEKLRLVEEYNHKLNVIDNLFKRLSSYEKQVQEIHDRHVKNTQAEESQIEEKLRELEFEFENADSYFKSLKEEEDTLLERLNKMVIDIRNIDEEIHNCQKQHKELLDNISQLQRNQTNKVTAFGGDKVINLLRAIERHHRRFRKPPIGPIGAHLTLVKGDKWAPAVEQALGRLLSAFIVTDHKDCLLLRSCAKEANYNYVQIIIYDFSRPRLDIPQHMLPRTSHPTTLSCLHSESHTVLNVLVDVGNAERQVLVQDYDIGKVVAFDSRNSNLKEVYTLDGYKMFSRASVETILPPNKSTRPPRLCSSYDEQIKNFQSNALDVQKIAQECMGRKRQAEREVEDLHESIRNIKRECHHAERISVSKNMQLRDFKKSCAAEASASPASTVDEIHQDISKIQEEIQQKKILLENFKVRMCEAEDKANELKVSFENLRESAKGEVDANEKAEKDLMDIEEELHSLEEEKNYYVSVMSKEFDEIKNAEAEYEELVLLREASDKKASIICPESELEAIGGCNGSTPEKLSAQITTLDQRLKQQIPRFSESIDDLRAMYEEKQSMILGKQEKNRDFRKKIDALQKALDTRRTKYQTIANKLSRQITWGFNNKLENKGICGRIDVSYEDRTLSVHVKMPQDASNSSVRDIKGLSGGERSFSTLCFTLALHDMIEAPFRAMDEFDVFMDAVSRKISLETLVDFALVQGSQWIFITPHDISMVKDDVNIKKQQMPAPRS